MIIAALQGTTDDICSVMANPLLQAGVATATGSISNPSDTQATIARGVMNAMATCTQQQIQQALIARGINPLLPTQQIVVVSKPWYEDWRYLAAIGAVVIGGGAVYSIFFK